MGLSADVKKFNELFTTYHDKFVRFATLYTKDSDAAEYFTTDALIYFWEKRNELPIDTNVPAYILTTIKHKCLNYLEHQDVKNTVHEDLQSLAEWELGTRVATLRACDPEELFASDVKDIINSTLGSLPEQTRRIFNMNRFEGLSQKDISAMLGISVKTVEYHISKAIKVLQLNLKDYLYLFIIFSRFWS
jgi:RNA polymerase sigma-70 factor (ECF subfamily)